MLAGNFGWNSQGEEGALDRGGLYLLKENVGRVFSVLYYLDRLDHLDHQVVLEDRR